MVQQLVNNIVHGVQDNIVRYCLNNAEQHDQFLPVYQSSAFFKDSSVVGQNSQRAHFPCSPPPPQDSLRSPKVWAENRRLELARGV
jgi:hypothetical protein